MKGTLQWCFKHSGLRSLFYLSLSLFLVVTTLTYDSKQIEMHKFVGISRFIKLEATLYG